MIRAFISRWWVVDPAGEKIGVLNRPTEIELSLFPLRQVMHPILNWVENNEAQASGVQLSMHYPDADSDGLPDKDFLLVLAFGPSGIEQFDNLSGVWMLPAWRFGKPVSELSSEQREAILSKIDNAGIPRSHFAGVETYGDFLKKIAKYFSLTHSGFGDVIETARAGEFE